MGATSHNLQPKQESWKAVCNTEIWGTFLLPLTALLTLKNAESMLNQARILCKLTGMKHMHQLIVYTGKDALGGVEAQFKSNFTDHWMSLRHCRNENYGKDFQKHPKDLKA